MREYTTQELNAIAGKALFGEAEPSRSYCTDWSLLNVIDRAAEAKYGVSIDYDYPPSDLYGVTAYANDKPVASADSDGYLAALCFVVDKLEVMQTAAGQTKGA